MSAADSDRDPLDHLLDQLDTPEHARLRETETFASLAGNGRKVVIFGCANLGMLLLAGARAAGLEVVAFADNNHSLQGRLLERVAVLSPADAVSKHNDEAFFVVAIYNSSTPRQQLLELGCRRIVPYAAFFWRFASSMPGALGLELPHRILSSADDIRAGYQWLHDPESRTEFVAQIAWRCTLDYKCLPAHDSPSDIHFPRDLIRLSDDEVFVDCGAFDGDSIRLFRHRTSGSYNHIYACEPDSSNRRRLERYIASLPAPECARISVLPFAIGDHDGSVRFQASGTVVSRIDASDGAESIECRRLDTLLDGLEPTFIKMDIEGSEPAAIAGATRTIRASRPILAVCAYHKCDHLWTLPALISTALPEYRISLRRYAEECWETVYYAVPPERSLRDS